MFVFYLENQLLWTSFLLGKMDAGPTQDGGFLHW